MTKRNIHTSVVKHAHDYTRSDSPWVMSESKSAYERMINYLSGGGMRTFGRTVHQEEVRIKRMRFVAGFGLLAAVWVLFWIF